LNTLAVIIASVIGLSACGSGSGASSTRTPTVGTYNRVTTDQPDPTQYEHTVHIVYAVPSGNEDMGRDKNYQLHHSIVAADQWFNDISSGKKLRLDLQDNGDVDITYWAMAETNEYFKSFRWHSRDAIADKLKETDWYNPNKLYVVYFEGAHFQTCGDGLTEGGHVVDFYLHNSDSGYGDCAKQSFATNYDEHGFNEYFIIHKIVHMLGVEESSDSVKDLMAIPWDAAWEPEFVDFNNDDYFMHTEANKVDILHSAFLLPSDGTKLPPNWRNND